MVGKIHIGMLDSLISVSATTIPTVIDVLTLSGYRCPETCQMMNKNRFQNGILDYRKFQVHEEENNSNKN
jgi:hypothetical protein